MSGKRYPEEFKIETVYAHSYHFDFVAVGVDQYLTFIYLGMHSVTTSLPPVGALDLWPLPAMLWATGFRIGKPIRNSLTRL
jgi:hypothetical protein